MFYFGSLHNFLSHIICSVLNSCVVQRHFYFVTPDLLPHSNRSPFFSKILANMVSSQLCDYHQSNKLFEDFSQDLELRILKLVVQKQH